MTYPVISFEPTSDHAEVSAEIERYLLDALASLNAQSTNESIVVTARDSNGRIVGGISGSTSYGWLLVKLLWVNQELRETGIVRALMAEAETRTKALGCHGDWLDTSSEHAHAFYLRLGYSDFGELSNGLSNDPIGHRRWFMQKAL